MQNNNHSNNILSIPPVQPVQPVQPPQPPDATPFVQALLEADGQLPLAAENMGITPSQFILNISRDPNAAPLLQQALRIFQTIKLFQTAGQAQLVLEHQLANLEPFEASKTFTNIATLIDLMTRNNANETNINIFDTTMRLLPPEVRQAVQILSQQNSEPKQFTIDHENTDDD